MLVFLAPHPQSLEHFSAMTKRNQTGNTELHVGMLLLYRVLVCAPILINVPSHTSIYRISERNPNTNQLGESSEKPARFIKGTRYFGKSRPFLGVTARKFGSRPAMSKICVVVTAVPLKSVGTVREREEILRSIFTVTSVELELRWLSAIFRNPDQLVFDSDDFDDDDQLEPRIIATCTVSGSAWLRLGDEFLLKIFSSQSNETELKIRKCEVWLTAPCIVPLFEKEAEDLCVQRDDDSLKKIQIMREFGMLIMKCALDPVSVDAVHKAACQRIGRAEHAAAQKRPDLRLGIDLFAFSEFSSRGGQRFDLLFSEDDAESRCVFEAARTGPWVPIIRLLLGDDFQCLASVVYSRPGSEAQDWHTDGAHIGHSEGWDETGFEADPPYALCVFIALVDLDRTVGFTQFWPGTHRYADLAGFGGAAPVLGCAVDGIVPAGGCVVYDYRLMHRGMPNVSEATQRPVLQLLYHVPTYKETKNYGLTRLFDAADSARQT
jgi:hypothetical protein